MIKDPKKLASRLKKGDHIEFRYEGWVFLQDVSGYFIEKRERVIGEPPVTYEDILVGNQRIARCEPPVILGGEWYEVANIKVLRKL
jgi:hypothetical protein